MATPVWQAGHLYQPGALVRPNAAQAVDVGAPENPGFESGTLVDWSYSTAGGAAINPTVQGTRKFAGTYALRWAGAAGTVEGGRALDLINDDRAVVAPGQSITASCYIMYNPGGFTPGSSGYVRIYWYNAANVLLSFSDGTDIGNHAGANRWALSTVTAVAPPLAAFASAGARLLSSSGDVYADSFSWNYAYSGVPLGLIFKATQATAGFSGNAEPAWPVVAAGTVVDNEVTWEGVLTSRVTWEAHPILVSGATEPSWPLLIGGNVVDGTISWRAISRRVEDSRCPNSKVVMIAASKIFAADDDIIPYSATVNPLDWSTTDDAGYLPFGLQTYGSNPVAALGLYRGNLMAFNSAGFQMWQVDQDPASMALLDAIPVGCTYPKSIQPVSNDLAFLTSLGIRNVGIAGASTNLQAGDFGKAIDPLVQAAIAFGFTPRGLYHPAQGQYWLFFGAQAFVLTMNGGGTKDMSWSRYVLPAAVDDWTVLDNDLYLRAGNLVWRVSDLALKDDMAVDPESGDLYGGTDFSGLMWWAYLDLQTLGRQTMLHGFDLVGTGEVNVQFAYDQSNAALVTSTYIVQAETLPGMPIAMPISAPSIQLRLTFSPNQAWRWNAAKLYDEPVV